MDGWEPTMNLRFVQRLDRRKHKDGVVRTVRILQQQWVKHTDSPIFPQVAEYEWRDVPEVEE